MSMEAHFRPQQQPERRSSHTGRWALWGGYHPMEATGGHLIGFFYMFLLLLQGSLFFTRVHVNRWWTLTQEVLVGAHGALVAFSQANGMWPMFLFGFGGIFVVTQMHGLGWPRWAKAVVGAAYAGLVLLVYGGQGAWAKIHQIAWIPVVDYGGLFVLAALVAAGVWMARRIRKERPL